MDEALGRLTTSRKTGAERFHDRGKELDFNLLTFWQWSTSDLVSNVTRGRFAEYLVARALGLAAARIFGALADLYPGSLHVSDVGLAPASDRAIWAHARDHGFVIVSKDEDFHRLSVLHGPPPKVIWIRLGNCSTDDVIRLLRMRRDEIEGFVEHEDASFLALA